MGDQDGAGAQEGSAEVANTRDNGDRNRRDAAEMKINEDGGGRDAGWWRQRRTRTAGDKQVDDESGIRHVG